MVKTSDPKSTVDIVRDPGSLSMIERIFYYEHFSPTDAPLAADNDNATAPGASRQQVAGSACFDAWALPDYLRR